VLLAELTKLSSVHFANLPQHAARLAFGNERRCFMVERIDGRLAHSVIGSQFLL
jgi:hypothetical protein